MGGLATSVLCDRISKCKSKRLGRQVDQVKWEKEAQCDAMKSGKEGKKYSVKRPQTFGSTLVYEVNVARF